jgi:hypothetical protein
MTPPPSPSSSIRRPAGARVAHTVDPRALDREDKVLELLDEMIDAELDELAKIVEDRRLLE